MLGGAVSVWTGKLVSKPSGPRTRKKMILAAVAMIMTTAMTSKTAIGDRVAFPEGPFTPPARRLPQHPRVAAERRAA